MARLQAGITLAVDHTIVDTAQRVYTFEFLVRDPEDVTVLYDDDQLDESRYTARVNIAGTGGTVTLLDATETTDPLTLVAGGTLRIERSTVVERAGSYGTLGYAQAIVAELEARRLHQIMEELASRLVVHADIHLSEDEIRALLGQIEITAIADGAVDLDALAAGVRQRLDDKIESGSLEFDPDLRLLTWVDGSGTASDATIPGGAANPTKAEIYRLLKTILVEGADIDFTYDDATSDVSVAAVGGGQRAGFLRRVQPAAAVAVTTNTPSPEGSWGDWETITTLTAITAEEAGEVILTGELHAIAPTGSGGGDRAFSEGRIVLRRNGADMYPSDMKKYGPRRLGPSGGTSTAYAEATREASWELVSLESAQEGDVFRVEARAQLQATSGAAIDLTFAADQTNRLSIAALGGPRGAPGVKGDKGDHGIRPYTRTLAAGVQVVINQRNVAFLVPGVTIPEDEEDRFIGILVAATGIPDGATSIPVSTYDTRTLVVPGGALTPVEGVEWTNEVGGGTHRYVATRAANRGLVLAADDGDTYHVTVTITEPDIRAFARRSGTAKIQRGDLAPDQQIPALTDGQQIRGDAAGNPEAFTPPQTLPAPMANKWVRGNAGGDAYELFDDPLPAPVEGNFLRWLGGKLANIAAPILTIMEVDNRIAPFARAASLVGATISKVQEIINAFTGGGWADAAGDAADVPAVRLEIKASQYNAVDIKGGTYALQQHQGPHVAAGYFGVRLPAGYTDSTPLARVRLYMGDEVYGPDDPEREAEGYKSYLLDEAPVTHITTDADYAYYSVGPIIHPAGAYWRAQILSLFRLNRNRIGGNELVPPPGQDGQIVRQVAGAPAWSDERTPVTLGQQLVVSRNFTINLALGTDRDVRSAAPTYWDPVFDLDDTDKQQGELHASCDLRIDNATDVNMSFVRGKANATAEDRRRVFSNIVFIGRLRDAMDFVFSATEDLAGVNALEMPIYSLNTVAGTAVVMGVHNDDNHGGDYIHYEGEAGATTPVLRGILNVTWTPTDPGRAVGYKVRGRHTASTSALPVAAQARGVRIGAQTPVGSNWPFWWQIQPGVEDWGGQGSIVSNHAFNPPLLIPPPNAPSESEDGFIIRTKVGAQYIQTVSLNWGPGTLTVEGSEDRSDYSETTLFFRGGAFATGDAARLLLRYILTDEGYSQFELYGDGTALPADSTIEVYEKGVFLAD